MQTFIKENSTLVAALLLPILFAGFFYISKKLAMPDWPPRHDFILVSNQNDYQQSGKVNVQIIGEKLAVTFTYPKRNEQGNMADAINKPELYFVDAKTMVAEPVYIPLPEDALNPPERLEGISVNIDLEKFKDMEFSAAPISPDGYQLGLNDSIRGNLMTGIFAASSGTRGPLLSKEGYRTEIKGVQNYYNFKILGWALQPANETDARSQ